MLKKTIFIFALLALIPQQAYSMHRALVTAGRIFKRPELVPHIEAAASKCLETELLTPRKQFDSKRPSETTTDWYTRNFAAQKKALFDLLEYNLGTQIKIKSKPAKEEVELKLEDQNDQPLVIVPVQSICHTILKEMKKHQVVCPLNLSIERTAVAASLGAQHNSPFSCLGNPHTELEITLFDQSIEGWIHPDYLATSQMEPVITAALLHEVGHNVSEDIVHMLNQNAEMFKQFSHNPEQFDQIVGALFHLSEFHADFFAASVHPKQYGPGMIKSLEIDALTQVACGLEQDVETTWEQDNSLTHPSYARRIESLRTFVEEIEKEEEVD